MTAGVRKFDQVNYYGIITAVPNATADCTWNLRMSLSASVHLHISEPIVLEI